MQKNKTLIIILAIITLGIWSCNDDTYDIAGSEQTDVQVFTGAIIGPVVQVGDSYFSIFKDKDSKVFLGKVYPSGKCVLTKDISSLFKTTYSFDSLRQSDLYEVNGNLALYQQAVKNYSEFYWKINILDTAGNILLELADTAHIADTIDRRHMITIADPEKIRSYYEIYYELYGKRLYGIAVDEYDYSGEYLRTIYDTSVTAINLYFMPGYRHNYSFIGMYHNYDTIGLFKFNYNDTAFVLKDIATGKFYETTYSTSLDQDIALLTVEDYDRELFIHILYDFTNMQILQNIDDPLLGRFLVTGVFRSGDNYVLTGFNWENEGFEFSYPNLLTAKGTWNTTVVNNGNIVWSSNQTTLKRFSLTTGTIQTSDNTFTTLGYGRTFNYFPATIVIKFNSNDFKIE